MDCCSVHTLAPMDWCFRAKETNWASFFHRSITGKKVSTAVDNKTYSYSLMQDIQLLYSLLSLQPRVSPLFPDKRLNSWMRIGWRLPFSLLFRLWLSWSWPTGYQSYHMSVRAVSQQFNSIKHLYQTSSCSFHSLSLILVYLPSCQ